MKMILSTMFLFIFSLISFIPSGLTAQVPSGHGGPSMAVLKIGQNWQTAIGGEGNLYIWDRIGVGGFGYVGLGRAQAGDDLNNLSISQFGLGGFRLSLYHHVNQQLSLRLPISFFGARFETEQGDLLETSGTMLGLSGAYRLNGWLRAGVDYQHILGTNNGPLGKSIFNVSLIMGGFESKKNN